MPTPKSCLIAASIGLCLASPGADAATRGQQPGTFPSGEQILLRYERFLGGAIALSKVTSRTVHSRRLEIIGQPADEVMVRSSKRPALSIMYHEALDGTFNRYTNGCDGAGGWTGYGGKPGDEGVPRSGESSTDGVCEQELYYYGYLPLDSAHLGSNIERLEVKGAVDIVPAEPGAAGGLAGGRGRDLIAPGPRHVYLVLSVPARPSDQYVWLYFDVESGALLRRADAGKGPAPVPAGLNPRFTDFIQYREVGDGTRAPFQFVTSAPGSEVRGIETSILDNEAIADEAFLRPKDVRRQDKGL